MSLPVARSRARTDAALTPAQRRGVAELFSTMREFSLFLTQTVELAHGPMLSSTAEVLALVALRLDGALRPKQIADLTGLTTGGVTNMLDRLDAAGLVERQAEVGGDRRGVLVGLTPSGRTSIDAIATTYARVFDSARHVTTRWRQLLRAAGREDVLIVSARSTSTTKRLTRLRKLEEFGLRAGQVVADVSGTDDTSPWRTFQVLWLAVRDDGARPMEIMAVTHLSSAGTSGLLDRLEVRGLVTRVPASWGDRRGVLATATDAGRSMLDAMADELAVLLDVFADALS